MRRLCNLLIVALGFLTVWNIASFVCGDFPDMIPRVPGDSNVMVLMDLEQIAASPLAMRQGWMDKRKAAYADSPLTFPPQVKKLIRAGHYDMESHLAKWQVALMETGRIPSLETIAQKENGFVDTVADTSTVCSPQGWYAFKVGSQALGMMFPANRQGVSRWIKEPPGRISPYLLQASGAMGPAGPQLLLIMDLEDVVKPQQLEERLGAKESLKGLKNIPEIAQTVASCIGVRIAVSIKEKATGTLTVDFARDTAALKDVAKPLILEAMRHAGLYIDDLESWTASVDNMAVTLKGDMSHSSLMRLSSLLELPHLPLDDSGRDADPVDAGNPKLYATQGYFKSIQRLLEDVLQKKQDATSFGQYANWIDQYARRIDRLPTLNVDDDMQKYSMEIAGMLHNATTSFRGVGINTAAQTAQVYGYGGYNYNGFRTRYDVAAQANAVFAQQRATGATTGVNISEQIETETTEIRRLMTERYKVNF